MTGLSEWRVARGSKNRAASGSVPECIVSSNMFECLMDVDSDESESVSVGAEPKVSSGAEPLPSPRPAPAESFGE